MAQDKVAMNQEQDRTSVTWSTPFFFFLVLLYMNDIHNDL